MPIPKWVTKWIQQEDDEFTQEVCNEGRNMYTEFDFVTSEIIRIQCSIRTPDYNRASLQWAVNYNMWMQEFIENHPPPTLDASEE